MDDIKNKRNIHSCHVKLSLWTWVVFNSMSLMTPDLDQIGTYLGRDVWLAQFLTT